jgi:acetyl esterase/lipase
VPSPTHQALLFLVPRLRRSGEVHGAAEVARLRADLLQRQAAHSDDPPRRVARAFEVRPLDGAVAGYELRTRGSRPRRTVVYVHGGGFVSGLDRFHWRCAARLAARLDVRVLLPTYPLAPAHTWRDALPPLVELFTGTAVDSPQGVVLMGDSAGGGLAMLLAQAVGAGAGPQPTHLVMLSPWLDLTGETPGTEEAAARDPWLTLTKLRAYGEWWGGGQPPDPDASPLLGDLTRLPRTLLLCGTRDLLVPQARALARRAAEAGADLTYVEEPGLMHVYPLLPVPEARRAWSQVAAFLSG